jgi:G3E family GTPase
MITMKRMMRRNTLLVHALALLPWAALALSTPNMVGQKPIPITILSGFLGSGKTSLLQNMLQNKEGLRVAVIVNDMASVNIDSKLVARDAATSGGLGSDGMLELQNGCACCSLSDELLMGVSELVTLSDLKGEDAGFHHIVVELSGISDPKSVRSKFQDAVMSDMPLMERVKLDTMVTLVDSSMFKEHFISTLNASPLESPELFYRPGEEPEKMIEEEWMKEMSPQWMAAVLSGLNAAKQHAEGDNGVAELLVSQAETADLLVLNKVDLVNDADLKELQELLAAMNPRATIKTTSFGKLAITSVLGIAAGNGAVSAGTVDDHRDYISAAEAKANENSIQIEDSATDSIDLEHSQTAHSHGHDQATMTVGEELSCTEPSHSHSHSHDDAIASAPSSSHSHNHDHAASTVCEDLACTDPSHSHSHSHDHAAASAPTSSHSHNHAASTVCEEPACTDPSHSHSHTHSHAADDSHSHSHGHEHNTDIGSFVYRARRPFHPGRLVSFLRNLPVVRGIPEASEDEMAGLEISDEAKAALQTTLRSKGFAWCADSHASAMYWSHAGKSFELSCLGQWWATLPRDQWPLEAVDYVLSDFDDMSHDDIERPENTVGDRRQEVVFIGPKFDQKSRQTLIRQCLDQCLLQDDEMSEYKAIQYNEEKLNARFANAIEAKILTY